MQGVIGLGISGQVREQVTQPVSRHQHALSPGRLCQRRQRPGCIGARSQILPSIGADPPKQLQSPSGATTSDRHGCAHGQVQGDM